jgi:putative transposase
VKVCPGFECKKWRNLEAAGESDWLVALKRESVIGPLAAQSRPGAQRVGEAARELGLGRSVVYDLLRRYRQRSQTSSLLPGKRGHESKVPLLGGDREQLLSACIHEFYLKPERPRLSALMLEVRRRFAEQRMPPPNYRTVVCRVEALDLRLATAKREGGKKARELLGSVAISTLQPEHPMDLLQIDHTPVDIIVVDQHKRLPIGRPWLTLAIDVRTRMVAGFHVSLWSPSTISVSLALSQAVLPKTCWLADRELQTLEWPVHGLPRTIHVDNAKEFYAEALVRGCQEYGIRLKHRPPGRPHFGGHVERLIGTMMGGSPSPARHDVLQRRREGFLCVGGSGNVDATGVRAVAGASDRWRLPSLNSFRSRHDSSRGMTSGGGTNEVVVAAGPARRNGVLSQLSARDPKTDS